jgi:hypothetical protein
MKDLFVTFLVFALCTSVSVSQETQLKKGKEQVTLSKDNDKINGIYYGQLKFKRDVVKSYKKGKLRPLKGVILTIRDKSTKKIIARTTADNSGKFKFNAMAMRKGLELSWDSPQQAGVSICENTCYIALPFGPSLAKIDEGCDDDKDSYCDMLMLGQVGLSNCFTSPCPWEMEAENIKLKEN